MAKDQPKFRRYTYDGPVVEFERCVADHWKATTYAPSEGKARSNMAHTYKVSNNKPLNAKVVLPGKIIIEEE